MYKKALSIGITLFLLGFTPSCMKLGPDFTPPEPGIAIPDTWNVYSKDENVSVAPKKAVVDNWWQEFGNPRIDRLIENTLAHNFDIRIATDRLNELQALFDYIHADRYPSINLQVSASRQKTADAFSFPDIPGIELDNPSNTYSLSVPAAFEIDFWGKISRSEEKAWAEYLMANETAKTIIQTIVAETVTLYLQSEALERRIHIVIHRIENAKRTLDIVENRYKRGLASILDVKQANSSLAQTQANLPALEQQYGTLQQQLHILQGRYPETIKPVDAHPENYLKQLNPISPGLPSELLLRRPDIRAAEEKIKSLNAAVGVAKTNRFPLISLTANAGYSNRELSDMFLAESSLWSIGAGIMQPVFNAGKLKALQKTAEAQFQRGLIEYTKTVLSAFSEVENALLVREKTLRQRDLIVTFLNQARDTHAVAQSHYERGLTDFLTVLNSELIRFQAEESLVLVDLAILANRVSLYRALGGGVETKQQSTGLKRSRGKDEQSE